MSAERRDDLAFELEQLDALVALLEEALTEKGETPMLTSHLGFLVHGLYHGFEKCLLFVLEIRGEPRPESTTWHRDLLQHFSEQLLDVWDVANELRSFRHVFRNAYSYELDFARVHSIAVKCPSFWNLVRAWFEGYIDMPAENPNDERTERS